MEFLKLILKRIYIIYVTEKTSLSLSVSSRLCAWTNPREVALHLKTVWLCKPLELNRVHSPFSATLASSELCGHTPTQKETLRNSTTRNHLQECVV